MKPIRLAALSLAAILAVSTNARAQSAAPTFSASEAESADTAMASRDSSAGDSTLGASNKGGLLGTVKSVAKNKVVQQVAKTAACTMLPGGQMVAGAIDAAANKDAVGAAAGAATGTTCMPGMGSGGAMAGGAVAAGALVGGAMPGGAMAGGMMGADPAMMEAAMRAFAGRGGQPTGADPAAMAAYEAQMAAAMQMAQARMTQGGAAGAAMPPGMAAGLSPEAMPTESVPLEVSADLTGDLKKGKTVIRNIDWVSGGAAVSPAAADGFSRAMARVAAAMKQAGGSYRLDLYMDQQSGNVVVRKLGPERLATVRAALIEAGASPGADGPQVGESGKHQDPRLEIVKVK